MSNTKNTSKTQKIVDETKTIEAKADESKQSTSKPFLTKKRIILTLVFVALSIGFMFITVFPILKINWHDYNVSIGLGIASGTGYLWLFIILVNMFINLNRCFITILPRIRKFGCKISYSDYMLYAITVTFLGTATPSNLVTDPYTIFWLKTHGVSTSKCASMLFTNTLLWQVAQILITTPFFIVGSIYCGNLISTPDGKFLYSMICIGVIIDYIGFVFALLLNMSKNFHYFCSRIFNWFKKKLHMKYHTKQETVKKYKQKAVMKMEFINSMKDWKTTSLIFMLFVLGDMLGIMNMCWSMYFVQYGLVGSGSSAFIAKAHFDFGWVLTCARLSIPANRLNMLPGQAMGYEAALVKLLTVYSAWWFDPSSITEKQKQIMCNNIVHNAVLTGKVFFSWIPALVGIGGFIALTVQQNKLAKQGKLITNNY